ncbi:MAG: hypothetical protein ACYSSL_09705 [Planctomycetota bacterium]|jgi:hypothetical protein
MEQETKNDDERFNRLFSQITAEKKKSIIALCLISVMVFMWVKVLSSKTPGSAVASVTGETAGGELTDSEPLRSVIFVEMPSVEGRNDVLTRNFFAADAAGGENAGMVEKASLISREEFRKIGNRILEKIKLEAISLGRNSQAFINGKMLTVGGKLEVKDGEKKYEFEIIGIEEEKVFIRCGEIEIMLKLTESVSDK